jgi:tetratricopeptide (TPR) repeat protein
VYVDTAPGPSMDRLRSALEFGDREEAAAIAEALRRDYANNVEQLLKLGRVCQKGGLSASARTAFHAAVECADRLAGALHHTYLGAATERYKSADFPEALQVVDQAFSLLAKYADLYELRGQILRAMNDIPGAIQSLEKALQLRPDDPKLAYELCRYLLIQAKYEVPGSVPAQQKFERVEELLTKVLESMRRMPVVDQEQCQRFLVPFVDSLLNQFKFQAAYDWLQSFVPFLGGTDAFLKVLAHTLHHWGRYDEAEQHYREALAVNRGNPVALLELAEILEMQGRHAEAVQLHARLIEATGDTTLNARSYAYALLAQGRVREGWARNMHRVEAAALAKLDGVRAWDGSDLSGRSIFVIAEGGTGDELRDAACYKEISEAAGRCTISCEPRLTALFSRSFPQARFWPVKRTPRVGTIEKMLSKLLDDEARNALKDYDFCVLGPDLFYHLKPSEDRYGVLDSYLVADQALRRHWRERLDGLGSGPKIGITWRTGTKLYRVDKHYTRLLDWGPIFDLPGVHFINLQYDECEQELREAEQEFGIRIHRWRDVNLKDDFDSVAALSRELDLVLAPNTTNLELAGAVGGRAWYLLNKPQAYDHWRLKDRDTGQDRLYPGVRIISADQPGDSVSLIARVARELAFTFDLTPRQPAQRDVVVAGLRQ